MKNKLTADVLAHFFATFTDNLHPKPKGTPPKLKNPPKQIKRAATATTCWNIVAKTVLTCCKSTPQAHVANQDEKNDRTETKSADSSNGIGRNVGNFRARTKFESDGTTVCHRPRQHTTPKKRKQPRCLEIRLLQSDWSKQSRDSCDWYRCYLPNRDWWLRSRDANCFAHSLSQTIGVASPSLSFTFSFDDNSGCKAQ